MRVRETERDCDRELERVRDRDRDKRERGGEREAEWLKETAVISFCILRGTLLLIFIPVPLPPK